MFISPLSFTEYKASQRKMRLVSLKSPPYGLLLYLYSMHMLFNPNFQDLHRCRDLNGDGPPTCHTNDTDPHFCHRVTKHDVTLHDVLQSPYT
jgi:hypothetical protein